MNQQNNSKSESNKSENISLDISSPEFYTNREISLLKFQERVLEQAKNEKIPILNRLRFLCISSTNLDEFFEVRVAGLKRQIMLNISLLGADHPDQLTPIQQLTEIREESHKFVEEQYRVLNHVIIPKLQKQSINITRRSKWSTELVSWVKTYFETQLFPILTPIALDPAHPFPKIQNKSLNFIVSLEGEDAFGRASELAVVQAPRALPRIIRVPDEIATAKDEFIFLSSIMHAHIDQLFPGMQVHGCFQFRVTRNSDLFIDDQDDMEDLLHAVEGELLSRKYGDSVRLEVVKNCPEELVKFLKHEFHLGEEDVFRVDGPVNLNRLVNIADSVNRPDLEYRPFTPNNNSDLVKGANIFEEIAKKDTLLHHPFDAFSPIIELLQQAAHDPHVVAIKQTLYRTGSNSVLVDLLMEAARAGKEVTVIIELRARFDEEANIQLANTLQEAGAHVVYGVVGYKTHSKMLLITRREKKSLRHYVHLGTGNYHAGTARLYTDIGLITCNEHIGDDVHRLFMQLTGMSKRKPLQLLLDSPFTLFESLKKFIRREAENAKAGKPARIIAKTNSLTHNKIIQELYKASNAGVKIDLIVRGISCLKPGIEGVSENITVRSIVGRFLEHSRIYYFENDGNKDVWLSSADLMERNLYYRVETCFPVLDQKLKKRVIEEGLEMYLDDNCQAWELQPDGQYINVKPGKNRRRKAAQEKLMVKSTKR